MRFILGLLVGYCIRGKQRLLIGTLTVIAVVCFIVLPAIALSLLALDVRRERLSRPPQTTVPSAPRHIVQVFAGLKSMHLPTVRLWLLRP